MHVAYSHTAWCGETYVLVNMFCADMSCPSPNGQVSHHSSKRSQEIASTLVHLSNELVDVLFPVTKVSTLDKVLELACPPAASGVGELEGPKEVGCLETASSKRYQSG